MCTFISAMFRTLLYRGKNGKFQVTFSYVEKLEKKCSMQLTRGVGVKWIKRLTRDVKV